MKTKELSRLLSVSASITAITTGCGRQNITNTDVLPTACPSPVTWRISNQPGVNSVCSATIFKVCADKESIVVEKKDKPVTTITPHTCVDITP